VISLIRQITEIKEIYGNEVRAIIHMSPEYFNCLKEFCGHKSNYIQSADTLERSFMNLPIILDINLKEPFKLEMLPYERKIMNRYRVLTNLFKYTVGLPFLILFSLMYGAGSSIVVLYIFICELLCYIFGLNKDFGITLAYLKLCISALISIVKPIEDT